MAHLAGDEDYSSQPQSPESPLTDYEILTNETPKAIITNMTGEQKNRPIKRDEHKTLRYFLLGFTTFGYVYIIGN